MEKITSLQNPRIKQLLKLSKARERELQQLFVIEGFHEVSIAAKEGYDLQEIFLFPEASSRHPVQQLVDSLQGTCRMAEVSRQVFERIAYRDNSDGIVATAVPRYLRLDDLHLSDNPFLIVLEAVEKPGNLGAIVRTADGAQADAVIVCDRQTDIYNPNAVRASIGCLFSTQVVTATSAETLQWLRQKNIRIFGASLQAAEWYHETDMTVPCAIVMGTESNGLTGFWTSQTDANIKIPMRGVIDSLNVSVATAVLAFEAMRQRGFPAPHRQPDAL